MRGRLECVEQRRSLRVRTQLKQTPSELPWPSPAVLQIYTAEGVDTANLYSASSRWGSTAQYNTVQLGRE